MGMCFSIALCQSDEKGEKAFTQFPRLVSNERYVISGLDAPYNRGWED